MTEQCPVCNSEATLLNTPIFPNSFDSFYSCKKCGAFGLQLNAKNFLTDLILPDIEKKQKMAILSHHIAVYNNENKSSNTLFLTKDSIEEILKETFPTPMEQMDEFILFLGEESKTPGKNISLSTTKLLDTTIYSLDFENTQFVINSAKSLDLIDGNANYIHLTLNGWEKYQELKKERKDSKKAFMAMQLDNTKLKDFLENYIRPEIEKIGFSVETVIHQEKPGLIDDKIRVEIRNSRFVIIDISDENRGAYWEAGYAEGLGKKVFYICDKDKWNDGKIAHFDVRNQQTFQWDTENPKDFTERLKASIRLTFPDAIQE